ncbi:MAG: hypothetical protein ACSLEL_00450 [Candidatus Malihini olakiniferum]
MQPELAANSNPVLRISNDDHLTTDLPWITEMKLVLVVTITDMATGIRNTG